LIYSRKLSSHAQSRNESLPMDGRPLQSSEDRHSSESRDYCDGGMGPIR